MKTKSLISWILAILILAAISIMWVKLINKKQEVKKAYLIKGKYVPYFFLAVDVSGSMKENDPKNYEAEALKNIIRTIYYNGKSLPEIADKPRIQLISFGDNIEFKSVYCFLCKF